MSTYKLVICEKPSVAKSISSVLGANKRGDGFFIGNGFIVSYCFGHLLQLAAPDAYGEYAKWRYEDLPIVPDKWKHAPVKDKAAQLKILKDLMNRVDVDTIICATDAGREGQNIFQLVYEYAKCKKPTKRLWISSMEDAAIKAGFENLKDGKDYDNLYAAASCRERADWIVGISATRAFSILYGTTLNVGRVQSPTLAMLVEREAEISGFVKKPFFTVELDCGGFTASSERFDSKADAGRVIDGIADATVTDVKQAEKSAAPPKLYDLTTLQREANRAHGFTAAQTLDYLQSLYEKKWATYPRSDSRYLTDDMAVGVSTLVAAIAPDAPCNAAQVINAAKVSDHHAIIPTSEIVGANLSALPSGEREVLDMIKNRLICAVGEKHRYLETIVTLNAGGVEFKAKGKTVTNNGWKSTAKDIPDDEDKQDQQLPSVAKGQTFPVTATIREGATNPPKHYTEDTLLLSMEKAGASEMPDDAERKGLGTPATRAAIIEKLIKAGFAERCKKNLLPTSKGVHLIAVLPEALTSARLTSEWENKLYKVQNGEMDGGAFLEGIAAFMREIIADNKTPKPEYISLFSDAKKTVSDSLGVCPRCGSSVRQGTKGFFCDSRTCGFKLWKESKFWTSKKKPLTAEIVAAMLKEGRVALKGLYSAKTGKNYDATAILDDGGGEYVNFKLEFNQNGRAKQ